MKISSFVLLFAWDFDVVLAKTKMNESSADKRKYSWSDLRRKTNKKKLKTRIHNGKLGKQEQYYDQQQNKK